MITLKSKGIKKYWLMLVTIWLISSTSFGEEIIELEFGNDADPAYLSFKLEGGQAYESDDEAVVLVSEEGLITAINYGETTVHVILDDKVIKSYLVIVYFVEEEETPFGQSVVLKPFLKGYPDHSFKPDQIITTGEASVMLQRSLSLQTTVYMPSEIKASHWAYDGVQSLMTRNLFFGDGSLAVVDRNFTKLEFKSFLRAYSLGENINLNQEAIKALASESTLTRGEMVYYLCLAFNQEPETYTISKAQDVKSGHKYYHYIQQNYQ